MANIAYSNAQSSNGICTIIAPAGPGVQWNLTALSISQAGPTIGPNAKVTIYDGTVAGNVLFAELLPGAGASSVGSVVDVKIPRGPTNVPGLQGTPGNAMTIIATGTGANLVSMNARLTDGLTA